MARKCSSSFVIIVLSLLPWEATLLIGCVTWLILSPVTDSLVFIAAGMQINDMHGPTMSLLCQTCVMIGQYLILLVCVFGAVGFVFGRQRHNKLIKDVKYSSTSHSLPTHRVELKAFAEAHWMPVRKTVNKGLVFCVLWAEFRAYKIEGVRDNGCYMLFEGTFTEVLKTGEVSFDMVA